MLDTTPTTITETTDWRDSIRVGDTVLFAFPLNEEGATSQPKPRPCLVVDINTMAGERFVTLAYGTTSMGRANRGEEVHVRTPAGRLIGGLRHPTRFVCARRVTVSANHESFAACPDRGSPIIGHLDADALERLHEIRARIHALRDIAAERRSRHEDRRRTRVRGVDFAVETRHPPKRIAAPGTAR